MQHIYLDESGNVDYCNPSELFLVVAVLAAGEPCSRAVKLHVARERKRAGRKAASELKASSMADGNSIKRLLGELAGEDIQIVAVVMDKRSLKKPPADPEDWYRDAAGLAVDRCFELWPELRQVTLDKRYTNPTLRKRLQAAIEARIARRIGRVVPVEQIDSTCDRCLQAVDYVAWAIRQKYQAGDCQYYDLIRGKVAAETVIKLK